MIQILNHSKGAVRVFSVSGIGTNIHPSIIDAILDVSWWAKELQQVPTKSLGTWSIRKLRVRILDGSRSKRMPLANLLEMFWQESWAWLPCRLWWCCISHCLRSIGFWQMMERSISRSWANLRESHGEGAWEQISGNLQATKRRKQQRNRANCGQVAGLPRGYATGWAGRKFPTPLDGAEWVLYVSLLL